MNFFNTNYNYSYDYFVCCSKMDLDTSIEIFHSIMKVMLETCLIAMQYENVT